MVLVDQNGFAVKPYTPPTNIEILEQQIDNKIKIIEQKINEQNKVIKEQNKIIKKLKSKIIKLEYKPNEIINCPTCSTGIEIDEGGKKFKEAKAEFNESLQQLNC